MLKGRKINFNDFKIKEKIVELYFNNKYGKDKIVIIDLEDLNKINYSRWHITNQGYVRDNNHHYIHNIIMNIAKPSYNNLIDHIDSNPLNNLKSNLQIVNQKININKRRVSKRSTSGIKNIHFEKGRNKWRVINYIVDENNRTKIKVTRMKTFLEAKKLMDEYGVVKKIE